MTVMAEADLLESALALAREGLFLLPCKGKKPVKGFAWGTASTTDPNTIASWFQNGLSPNIGIDCGKSRLLVIDIDPARGGNDSLALLEGFIDLGPHHVDTGAGGKHYYFTNDDSGIGNSVDALRLDDGTILPGIDIRANGGYVVAPPSIHPATGEMYRWCDVSEIPEVPKELLDLIRASKALASNESSGGFEAEVIPEGQRHNTLTSLAGTLRNRGLSGSEIQAILIDKNETCCDPALPEAEVQRIANDIGQKPSRNGTPLKAEQDEFDPVVEPRTVRLERLEWLYRPFIPKNKLAILAGEPKDGKSLIAVTIAAALSSGKSLPGDVGSQREPGTVIYMTAEDAFGDTLKPRFIAAGYEERRVKFVHLTTNRSLKSAEISEVRQVSEPGASKCAGTPLHREIWHGSWPRSPSDDAGVFRRSGSAHSGRPSDPAREADGRRGFALDASALRRRVCA